MPGEAGVGLSAAAGSATSAATGKDVKPQKHNFKSSLTIREEKLRRKAIEMKLAGKVSKDARVVQVAKGQYVQVARDKTDRIFVLLVEFGNRRHVLWGRRPRTRRAASRSAPSASPPAPSRTRGSPRRPRPCRGRRSSPRPCGR